MIPLVVASERGGWLNRVHVRPGGGCVRGVVGFVSLRSAGRGASKWCVSRSGLGWSAVDGESPVGENMSSGVTDTRVAAGPWNLL